jgi:hypothetical protein
VSTYTLRRQQRALEETYRRLIKHSRELQEGGVPTMARETITAAIKVAKIINRLGKFIEANRDRRGTHREGEK